MTNSVIDIIVPVFHLPDITINCFKSIKKYTNIPYRLIYIDNNSYEDEFLQISQFVRSNFKDYKILSNKENLGYDKACNQGIRLTPDRDVVLLNNDTEVFENWLPELQSAAYYKPPDNLPEFGVVSAYSTCKGQFNYIGHHWKTFTQEKMPGDWKEQNKVLQEKVPKVIKEVGRMVPFFCVYLKRSILNKVGLLSEIYELGLAGDDDYCAKLLRHQYRIGMANRVVVQHTGRTTFSRFIPNTHQIATKNVEIFKRKWAEPGDGPLHKP